MPHQRGPEADKMTTATTSMTSEEIRSGYSRLTPDIPWTHHFDLGPLETISAAQDDKFYRKAIGLKKIGELGCRYAELFTRRGKVAGARILDVASGEGGHSIAFARAGAAEVVGIEGRQLYVDRARFAAKALGVGNVRFERGDVRKISPKEVGTFDFVFCSGILHHLGADDFTGFLETMGTVTADTMMLYTHVSTPASVKMFNLSGPKVLAPGIEGHLFREHSDTADAAERERQVRASLDNTFSFWATEESLINALKRAGFGAIAKIFEPHAFSGYDNRNIRVMFIARRM
jgi:2-polyprenyl-3-methyl-5-hydroxy-6-metoxy-1,4-benzoquinol methylase